MGARKPLVYFLISFSSCSVWEAAGERRGRSRWVGDGGQSNELATARYPWNVWGRERRDTRRGYWFPGAKTCCCVAHFAYRATVGSKMKKRRKSLKVLLKTDDIRDGVEVFPERQRHSGAVEGLDKWKQGLTKTLKRKPTPPSASDSARLLLPSPSWCVHAPLVQNKPLKSRHGPPARILQHRVHLCLCAECEPPTLRTL